MVVQSRYLVSNFPRREGDSIHACQPTRRIIPFKNKYSISYLIIPRPFQNVEARPASSILLDAPAFQISFHQAFENLRHLQFPQNQYGVCFTNPPCEDTHLLKKSGPVPRRPTRHTPGRSHDRSVAGERRRKQAANVHENHSAEFSWYH
jgi:hypothetical protein